MFEKGACTFVQAMKAGLVSNVYLEAMGLKQHKKKYSEHILTDEMKQRIAEYAQDRDIYARMAKSLAPEIYGFEDVKKALMLLLVRTYITKHIARACGHMHKLTFPLLLVRGDS